MISLKDVNFHYGGENGTGEGIDDINLSIETGEFVVLCGRSGCGKTTLTRALNGLVPHFYEGIMQGEVWIDDFCVTASELSDAAAHVGSVFQNPKSQFFNVDTTGELVFGCENLGLSREEIQRRFDRTVSDMHLEALTGRNIFELSGGEKQQIACSSVYASEPPVFVMDEPSSNLDKKAIHRLSEALGRIKESGKTVIVSEHRLYYLMDLADRFVYLEDGRIAKTFTSEEMHAMTDVELAGLGLRCTDLNQVHSEQAVSKGAKNTTSSRGEQGVAIEGIDLSCNQGTTQILDIEKLQLPEGSVVALIGDNGSGKSTLAESLCGVIASEGSVAIGNEFMSDKQRYKNSFMVMQDVNHQLFADSVIEELTLNSSVTHEKASDILKQLDLSGCADRHPASLSGGQKQRVAIASALCAGKRVLFFDEPTSGLDRGGMERFGALLSKVKDRSDISIIITHDFELVMKCCTHVLHIENGRVSGVYPLNEEGGERVRFYFLSPSKTSESRRRKRVGMFGRILKYAGKYKKHMYLAVAVMLAAITSSIMPYLLVYGLIDSLISGIPITFDQGVFVVGAVALFELLYAILYIWGLSLSHKAAYHTLENIRVSLQEKLEKQPIGSIKGMGTGAVKKTLSEDVEALEVLLAHMIPEGIANLAVPAVSLIVMFAISWQMALFTIIVMYFGYLASRQMYAVGTDNMGAYFASTKRLNNTIIEYVNGMEVVKIFNRDGQASSKLRKTVKTYRDFALGWYKVCWPWTATYGSIFPTVVLYSLPIGALLVMLGQLSFSSYVLVLCLSLGFGPMLVHCLGFMSAVPQVNYKIQTLEKTLDRPPLKEFDASFAGKNHDVELKHVRFAYGDDEALKDVSLKVPEGSMCAIVGESGSGKSTVGRLIVHHYDVSSGSITIGGQDICKMSLEALNDQVSYVSQELFLFNTTIKENILFGRPGASDDEVREAACQAQCLDFIKALPDGFETRVGEGGNKLSGGERQRIAFARAILKNSPIIVLDEATAFIDPENEEKMTRAIREVIKSKTVIIIAHRLQTVAGADQILVFDDGRIIDRGTHEELLKTCERYRSLWQASERSGRWTVAAKDPAFASAETAPDYALSDAFGLNGGEAE